MAGTVLCTALMIPLVYPAYMLGSWRWLRRTRSTWELGFILFAFFFAWYFVLRLSGGSQILVPLAMLVLAGGVGAGRLSYLREEERRRDRGNG
jgi:hypothetical protein